jgi:hypothetical protein
MAMMNDIQQQKKFESELSALEAERAVFIDFEGFEEKSPTFVGVRIENIFEQLVFDSDLEQAAKFHNLAVVNGETFIRSLIEKARIERRRLVGFSSHEKTVIKEFFQLDISDLYADARLMGKFLRRTALTHLDKKPKDLTGYLHALGYQKKDSAIKKTTLRIRAVKTMLATKQLKYGEFAFEKCTPTVKAKWTKVLQHNDDDVNGMAFLVKKYIEEKAKAKR